jgi:hypothetical protein
VRRAGEHDYPPAQFHVRSTIFSDLVTGVRKTYFPTVIWMIKPLFSGLQ